MQNYFVDLLSGPFTQPVGPDQLLQFFQMDFTITTNSSDTITIHLPDSVASSVTAVPEPSSILLIVAGNSLVLILFGVRRRFLERIRPIVAHA